MFLLSQSLTLVTMPLEQSWSRKKKTTAGLHNLIFPKDCQPQKKNYSTYDRELLAMYLAIKYFKHMLEGQSFTVYTDHRALLTAFKEKSYKTLPRHLNFVEQNITGKDNIPMDFFSRIEAIDFPSALDYDKLQIH